MNPPPTAQPARRTALPITAGIPGFSPAITLAQFGNPLTDQPPVPLPGGPLWKHLLLEQPWPLAAVCLISGVAAWTLLSRLTPSKRLAIAAIGPALALAVWLLARSVRTPREQLREATLAMIASAFKVDMEGLDRTMVPGFTLYLPGGRAGLSKDRVLRFVQTELGRSWKASEWAVIELQAVPDSEFTGQTQAHIRATLDGFLTFSWWKFDWERDQSGTWKATAAEPANPSADSWMSRYGN